MSNPKVALTFACVLGATLALLSACREEEQGRVLIHEKGVYLGPPDQTISDETLEDLRYRVLTQER
ncbi:MAG: hypothetical protein ACE5MH_11180 [Terriglobia bacterium]